MFVCDFDAVGGVTTGYQPLYDPFTDETLDLAFVISPELATLTVLSLDLLPVLIGKSRKLISNRRMRKNPKRGSKQQ